MLHPIDGQAEVRSGDVTYFPRPPSRLPCGSFLVAKALLEGVGPRGGREVGVAGPE